MRSAGSRRPASSRRYGMRTSRSRAGPSSPPSQASSLRISSPRPGRVSARQCSAPSAAAALRRAADEGPRGPSRPERPDRGRASVRTARGGTGAAARAKSKAAAARAAARGSRACSKGPAPFVGLAPDFAKSRLQPGQLLPGRGEPLELDLAERTGCPLPVEERDRGDADLRERPASRLDAQPGRVRPRAQHRSELEARGSSRDELAQLLRRPGGTAGRLDVERRDPVADDAQPPEPLAVLDPAPQHEPGEPEPPARGVVEDLREDAPREQLVRPPRAARTSLRPRTGGSCAACASS